MQQLILLALAQAGNAYIKRGSLPFAPTARRISLQTMGVFRYPLCGVGSLTLPLNPATPSAQNVVAKNYYLLLMENLQATQIAHNFPQIAANLQKGKRFGVLYGKAKKPVAMLVPFEEKAKKRKIGILDGKAKIEFAKDFKITTKELLGLK